MVSFAVRFTTQRKWWSTVAFTDHPIRRVRRQDWRLTSSGSHGTGWGEHRMVLVIRSPRIPRYEHTSPSHSQCPPLMCMRIPPPDHADCLRIAHGWSWNVDEYLPIGVSSEHRARGGSRCERTEHCGARRRQSQPKPARAGVSGPERRSAGRPGDSERQREVMA
jgi:hypothetical protein